MADLPAEVVCAIVCHCDFDAVCSCRAVCTQWHSALSDPSFERAAAEEYAHIVLKDTAFWERAAARPREEAKPLRTWHAETVRVHEFLKVCSSSAADY